MYDDKMTIGVVEKHLICIIKYTYLIHINICIFTYLYTHIHVSIYVNISDNIMTIGMIEYV
jgi:hypothetical protein